MPPVAAGRRKLSPGLLTFLPVLGAALAHAPVLRFDLLEPLKRPIDGGRTLNGRRLLGDNKTWRGALVMLAGVEAAALALDRVPAYCQRLPPGVQAAGPIATGALLGLAAVAGELPNSFAKRQLGVGPGGHARGGAGIALSILDQADFVLAAWPLLAGPPHDAARGRRCLRDGRRRPRADQPRRLRGGRPDDRDLTSALQIHVQRLCVRRDRP